MNKTLAHRTLAALLYGTRVANVRLELLNVRADFDRASCGESSMVLSRPQPEALHLRSFQRNGRRRSMPLMRKLRSA